MVGVRGLVSLGLGLHALYMSKLWPESIHEITS